MVTEGETVVAVIAMGWRDVIEISKKAISVASIVWVGGWRPKRNGLAGISE